MNYVNVKKKQKSNCLQNVQALPNKKKRNNSTGIVLCNGIVQEREKEKNNNKIIKYRFEQWWKDPSKQSLNISLSMNHKQDSALTFSAVSVTIKRTLWIHFIFLLSMNNLWTYLSTFGRRTANEMPYYKYLSIFEIRFMRKK